MERSTFAKHPWSIGGGGAADLKEAIEATAETKLSNLSSEIGIVSVTGEDDVYLIEQKSVAERYGIENTRPLVMGDLVRDWVTTGLESLWLYDQELRLQPLEQHSNIYRFLWPFRSNLSKRKRFGTPMLERGLTWYEWQELYTSKLKASLTITFGEVATHNHFVLDRGGKVFNRTAPVIKLPVKATEDDYLGLLSLLNSLLEIARCAGRAQGALCRLPKAGEY